MTKNSVGRAIMRRVWSRRAEATWTPEKPSHLAKLAAAAGLAALLTAGFFAIPGTATTLKPDNVERR